jgi:hypothetical protein
VGCSRKLLPARTRAALLLSPSRLERGWAPFLEERVVGACRPAWVCEELSANSHESRVVGRYGSTRPSFCSRSATPEQCLFLDPCAHRRRGKGTFTTAVSLSVCCFDHEGGAKGHMNRGKVPRQETVWGGTGNIEAYDGLLYCNCELSTITLTALLRGLPLPSPA